MHTDGTWELHGSSRRKNTDKDVLFNYIAFFIGLLRDALEQFGWTWPERPRYDSGSTAWDKRSGWSRFSRKVAES